VKQTHAVHLCLTVICAVIVSLPLAPAARASSPKPVQLFAFSCEDDRPQNCPQGSNPQALIQASDGNFYGAATHGGSQGLGTIFKVTPGGQFTLLFTFESGDGEPGFSLVEAKDGTLWGATIRGGQFGNGVVFKINKDGTGFQIVHSFPAKGAEFFFNMSLTVGRDGNIYGSSPGGGILQCGGYGCGIIFRINPKTGAFKTLHTMNGGSDGANPSGLIQASDENFYGVATNKVFRVTPSGKFTVVRTFPFFDFAYQNGSLAGGSGVIQASNGELFGVVEDAKLGEPRLYKLALDGSRFHVFPGIPKLRFSILLSNLIMASDGNLWLSSYGESGGQGAIVQLSPQDGSVHQNIAFDTTNGAIPSAPLIQGSDGNLYGTTLFGGTVSSGTPDGVVFRLAAGRGVN
jgi:uncharacterized repeat protein (TIGR03803 family)